MDYKNLLTKYIRHVSECEGTSFIDQMSTSSSYSIFSSEEVRELELLEQKFYTKGVLYWAGIREEK